MRRQSTSPARSDNVRLWERLTASLDACYLVPNSQGLLGSADASGGAQYGRVLTRS